MFCFNNLTSLNLLILKIISKHDKSYTVNSRLSIEMGVMATANDRLR